MIQFLILYGLIIKLSAGTHKTLKNSWISTFDCFNDEIKDSLARTIGVLTVLELEITAASAIMRVPAPTISPNERYNL